MEQRSSDWYAARRGKFTASEFADLMAGETTAGYLGLLQDKAWEIWSGKSIESYTNAAMQRGVDLEAEARDWFCFQRDVEAEEVGFLVHPTMDFVGCSPDGLIGETEMVEIKCPLHRAHMETVRTQEVPAKYRWQVQGQLWVAERERNYYVSYNPEAPKQAIIVVERDDKAIQQLEARAKKSWERVQEMLAQLNKA